MIPNILCPVDFSEGSKKALRHAVRLASQSGARLIAVHILHLPLKDAIKDSEANFQNRESENIHQLEALLAAYQAEVGTPELSCGAISKVGLLTDEIAKLVEEYNPSLIITATKGSEGFHHLIGGGTHSVDILKRVSCPVLIIPEKAPDGAWKHVVYTTDLSSPLPEALEETLSLAHDLNAKVSFLNIQNEAETGTTQNIIEAAIRDYLSKSAALEVSFHVLEYDDPIDGIEQFCAREQGDLVVMTTRHRSLAERLFTRSITQAMAFYTHLPLLIFKREG